ncbi:MAG: twin-arginine translocase TatA/TatE family subunit [Myxococcales bacterium]|nr:twin-arginine translocase TatA/TatE family subunit [Myxococcales bacterium]
MSVGVWQIVIIVAVVALLFGGKGLSKLGGELGRGVRSVRKGLSGAAEAAGGDASRKTWVESAAQVAKTAQQVRRATRLGRRFPFG